MPTETPSKAAVSVYVPLARNFSDEYQYFLENYLFHFFGMKGCALTPENRIWKDNQQAIRKTKNHLVFYAGEQSFFNTEIPHHLLDSDDSIKLANSILLSFFKCSEHMYSRQVIQNRYRSTIARDKAYKLAIQDGLSLWLFGSAEYEIVSRFFDLLEKWSVKTYEGKHVTLGFLINPSSTEKAILSFDELLSFLSDDSSAVISDCIHSVIELDKNCNLVRYHSITDNLEAIPACELNENIPLRFLQVVQQFVPFVPAASGSDKVGVFLLSNGDILIVKNGTTRFVKRNLQWLNLSKDAFIKSLLPFAQALPLAVGEPHGIIDILQSIYASVLDVSFSHTGGIIAIIDSDHCQKLTECGVLSPYDNLQIFDEDAERINAELGRTSPEKDKKIRRKLLKQLVGINSFYNLDRKLRCELISLDGACIVDYNGTVYSFGAIIQNDSGSATGGRSAAAKKLSEHGAAIKVSTDGYIDVYIKQELVYSIK